MNSAKKNNKIVTDYVYDWTGEVELKQKDIVFNPKRVETNNKMVGS